MTVPTPSSVSVLIKKLSWASFAVICFGFVVDKVFGFEQSVARGVALGALLVVLMQSVFAVLTFKAKLANQHHIDTRPPNQILMSMTQALVVKWLILFVGFALIFKLPYVISYPAVFIGFFAMQFLAMGFLVRFRS